MVVSLNMKQQKRRFRRGRPITTGAGILKGACWTSVIPPVGAVMLPELVAVGTRFNSWETVGIAWRLGQYRYVPAKCVGASCTTRRVVQYDNLTSGKSRGCHACGSTKATPRWLRDRMRAAQQRCRNPHAPAYKHYGSRGIKFKFKNPEVAARWVEEHLGLRREAYI